MNHEKFTGAPKIENPVTTGLPDKRRTAWEDPNEPSAQERVDKVMDGLVMEQERKLFYACLAVSFMAFVFEYAEQVAAR